MTGKLCLALLACSAAACGNDGLSTAEVQEAAKERVRQSLGLQKQASLFTNVYVGEPLNGETVLCGTVEGKTADGAAITPRRFIAAVEPARWVKFEPANGPALPTQPDMFVEWRQICVGESEV